MYLLIYDSSTTHSEMTNKFIELVGKDEKMKISPEFQQTNLGLPTPVCAVSLRGHKARRSVAYR